MDGWMAVEYDHRYVYKYAAAAKSNINLSVSRVFFASKLKYNYSRQPRIHLPLIFVCFIVSGPLLGFYGSSFVL